MPRRKEDGRSQAHRDAQRARRKVRVGRIDHVEDRLVGIKSRETYECPAAITLITAHRALESLTLPKNTIEFKRIIEQKFSEIIYDGLWYEGLRENLQAFIESTQEYVTGVVRVKLYKGTATVVGRRSPYSLYDVGLSTYAKGDGFDHSSAVGFIYCWGLPGKTAAKAHAKAPKKTVKKTAAPAKKTATKKK